MGFHGTIHYHIVCKGPRPSKKWVKEKWHRLSNCYYTKISDAHENIPWYLIEKNAAALPNHKEGVFAWSESAVFQRIRATSNLFPKSKNLKKPEKGRFEVHHLSDEEIERLEKTDRTD
jgi:hypothetical protein